MSGARDSLPIGTTSRLRFGLPPLSLVRSLTGETGDPGLSHDMVSAE